MTRHDTLDTAQYVCLATQRKNGTVVNTPVWGAKEGRSIYVFSAGEAGKVKRLRNFPRLRVAPCSMLGTITGEWQDAEGVIVTDLKKIREAHAALKHKYGWQLRTLDFCSMLGGKIQQRAWIEITLV